MATKKSQRMAIIVIMVVMVVGTLGSFAAMVLAQGNNGKVAADFQKASAAYEKEQKAYQAKIDAQGNVLSEKYYPTFSQYSDRVAKYDIDSVKSLTTDDLLVGGGKKIDGTTGFAAYYVGWDANGNIFDQSIDTAGKKLKAPLYDAVGLDKGLDSASLIEGWKEGMKGMNIGGVRLITIPSDKAYGAAGSGENIAPNMPLKFVVMAIPAPEKIPQSESLTKATEEYYKTYAAYAATQ